MSQPAAEPLLSARSLVKTFGPVRAVDGVSLDVYAGEVLGIIGDNGAGKSTFLSLLTGFHHPDSGSILYRGKQVSVGSPRVARNALKIEMIYQKLELAPDLPVWQNLFLGEELRRFGVFSDRAHMRCRAGEILRELNLKITADDILGELSGGEQQAVAIGRALLFDRQIIIMDEPTAAISVQKVQDVLTSDRPAACGWKVRADGEPPAGGSAGGVRPDRCVLSRHDKARAGEQRGSARATWCTRCSDGCRITMAGLPVCGPVVSRVGGSCVWLGRPGCGGHRGGVGRRLWRCWLLRR